MAELGGGKNENGYQKRLDICSFFVYDNDMG